MPTFAPKLKLRQRSEAAGSKALTAQSHSNLQLQAYPERGARTTARFAHDFGRIPLFPRAPATILPGPGVPLDAAARARYEPGLRASLADVRIHDGVRAAASADALDADAYTVGRDIVFGAGRYQPGSAEGQRLLAHELAHAVQQRGATTSGSWLAVSRPGDPVELAAERAADALMSGRAARLVPGSESPAIHRQPRQGRADDFLDRMRDELKELGRGELDNLIPEIVADGNFHQVQQETIGEVEHTWEVRTRIVELTDKEKQRGAEAAGALKPEKTIVSPDGKRVQHQLDFFLRGGGVSTIDFIFHELIHLRIAIDRYLPPEKRSSFFREYSQLNEMTEVLEGAKFGASSTIDKKSSYGALPLAIGSWEQVKTVLERIEAIRSFYMSQDEKAPFDTDPLVTPAALIEYVVQEKYVSQKAAREVVENEAKKSATQKAKESAAKKARGETVKAVSVPGNATLSRRYAPAVMDRFEGLVSKEARERINESPVGQKQVYDLTDRLRVALERLYDALDKKLKEIAEFKKEPPSPPDNMLDPNIFETRPLDIGGKPIPM